VRAEPQETMRIGDLLARGEAALQRSGSAARAACIVHMDLHHGNVVTADRIYFIDWEYAQLGDPLLDLACVMAYYPRAVAHGPLLLEASGLAERGVTAEMLVELTRVFNLLTYLWYRARRVSRTVPATDLQLESTALRRALVLAPDGEPRHT
jgi:thiamine kinase-like enzyme